METNQYFKDMIKFSEMARSLEMVVYSEQDNKKLGIDSETESLSIMRKQLVAVLDFGEMILKETDSNWPPAQPLSDFPTKPENI